MRSALEIEQVRMRKFNIIMILRLRFATKDLFALLSALASQEAHFPVLVSEGLAWFVCLVIGELLAQLATGILPSSLSLSQQALAGLRSTETRTLAGWLAGEELSSEPLSALARLMSVYFSLPLEEALVSTVQFVAFVLAPL